MPQVTKVFIGIGSNSGDKEANIGKALKLLGETPGVTVHRVAPLYRTEPVGYIEQDWFLNTVAEVSTVLSPRELLDALLGIEKSLGRVRTVRWGPRPVDLDIILYGNGNINEPDLVIPHPGMCERAFVVAPLADLVPDLVLPGGKKAADLAAFLRKEQPIERY
ncbi:MAG: 2-amino-4-hydroxy-6-hydroxymethyldihydropteridine diphosphokinase [Peptococcaceae bacterium]|nr:MAG: 2-amino-4-hydroxy-6-hydroxymethyldihydropteridine diphosphokinase [Peptococcaceae bacterium]